MATDKKDGKRLAVLNTEIDNVEAHLTDPVDPNGNGDHEHTASRNATVNVESYLSVAHVLVLDKLGLSL